MNIVWGGMMEKMGGRKVLPAGIITVLVLVLGIVVVVVIILTVVTVVILEEPKT